MECNDSVKQLWHRNSSVNVTKGEATFVAAAHDSSVSVPFSTTN